MIYIACIVLVAIGSYHFGRARQLTLDVPRMRPLCDYLEAFIVNELDSRTYNKFRTHLRSCKHCQNQIRSKNLLASHLEELGISYVRIE